MHIKPTELSASNRSYIDQLRGFSILRVMLVHLGLSWFFPPYSTYIGAFLPLLFFVSGAVSYYSFQRANSVSKFLLKRLLSILVPYYLLVLMIVFFSFFIDSWSTSNLINWLLIAPDTNQLPFSLAQTWFLQTLFLISFISIPIFYLAKKSLNYLYGITIVCLVIILINSFHNIHNSLFLFGVIDLYSAFSNSFFFLLGCIYFINEDKLNKTYALLCALALILAGIFLIYQTSDYSLGSHRSSPTIIYVFFAVGLSSLLLIYKDKLQMLLNTLYPIKSLLIYCSKHSYSLYLLHTLVLGAFEAYIFKEALTGQHLLALLKLFLVISVTIIIAPIFTQLSSSILLKLKGRLI